MKTKEETINDLVNFETKVTLNVPETTKRSFIAGAEWQQQKAIEAHWKCCPNLSKDNNQMCKHLTDCNRQCLYMTEFINQL